jgi:pSer/pThr/pTyr-binding forkhead associated (FHA) protein
MGGDLGQFLEACGANGPLRLEWDDCEDGRTVCREFGRPAIVIGRSARADLVLDHPLVGRRHAYLQLVEGRLFAIDLGSREGLRWGGVPRGGGWLDRSRPVQVGGTTIRLVEADQDANARPGPGPTSRRYESCRQLPCAVLDFRSPGNERRRLTMDRVLTLVGGSERCHLRLPGPESSRAACGLVLTPIGVWAVDLLSSKGVTVNGVLCRQALLEDGDVLQIGTLAVRLTYRKLATPPRTDPLPQPAAAASPSGSDKRAVGPLPPALIDRPDVLLSPEILGSLFNGADPDTDAASSPFGQALILLIRLLGDMHRDHLTLVREELEQIRKINAEMNATRSALTAPESANRAGTAPAGGQGSAATGGAPAHGDMGLGLEAPHPRTMGPEAIHSLVGERLVAWEHERLSRWQRVIELLVKR